MKLKEELAEVRHMLNEDTDIEGGPMLMACACIYLRVWLITCMSHDLCTLKTLSLISSLRLVAFLEWLLSVDWEWDCSSSRLWPIRTALTRALGE